MNPIFLRLASSVRFGYATNSSSSHSILLLEPAQMAALESLSLRRPDPGEYGWEWFTITDHEDKLDYLWADLYLQIQYMVAAELSDLMIRQHIPNLDDWTKHFSGQTAAELLEHMPASCADEPTIDHQSCFSFPLDPATRLPNEGFVRWFRDRVLHPNVAIFGGNDNEDAPSHFRPFLETDDDEDDASTEAKPTPGKNLRAPLDKDEFHRKSICHDRENHWLLFSPHSGTKLRVPKIDGERITFSNIPELVDVKLTDKCAMGCTFCYQGSTPGGAHPEIDPYHIAGIIKGLGVLEVAIGGGEPLEYPGFWTVVDQLQGSVIVNVTTRRLDLIPAHKIHKLGGIGFSVESAVRAEKALDRLGIGSDYSPWRDKIVLHVVLGAAPMADILDICRVAKERRVSVLFLAFKTDGRGQSFQPFPHEDWIEQLRAAFWHKGGYWNGPALGVDTPTVDVWGAKLREVLGVDPRLMSMGEGQFSLYVDFVGMAYAKASYGDIERIPLNGVPTAYPRPDYAEQILQGFRSWHN